MVLLTTSNYSPPSPLRVEQLLTSQKLDLRQDFTLGILESELLDLKIHIHAIEEEYAARVRSLNTYAAISKDIINRWTYPLVPDNNISGYIWECTNYTYTRPNIYKEKSIKLSRTAKVGRGTVLGAGTVIESNSLVIYSILGRNCTIGENVKIINSYLWGNVTIENDCIIENSIICNDSIIKSNSHIQSGCLISYNCVIGPNVNLEPETKITTHNLDSFSDFHAPSREIFLGSSGHGFSWTFDEGDPTNSLSTSFFLPPSSLSLFLLPPSSPIPIPSLPLSSSFSCFLFPPPSSLLYFSSLSLLFPHSHPPMLLSSSFLPLPILCFLIFYLPCIFLPLPLSPLPSLASFFFLLLFLCSSFSFFLLPFRFSCTPLCLHCLLFPPLSSLPFLFPSIPFPFPFPFPLPSSLLPCGPSDVLLIWFYKKTLILIPGNNTSRRRKRQSHFQGIHTAMLSSAKMTVQAGRCSISLF